jgi:hypothetical protein
MKTAILIVRVAFLFISCCAPSLLRENRNLRPTENYYVFGSRTKFSSNDSTETGRFLAPMKSSFRKLPSKISSPSISLESVPSNLFMQILAGSSATGFSGDNNPATSANINGGYLWVVSNGNIYIPDTNNRKIRKVVNGIIITFAGSSFSTAGVTGTRTSVLFSNPLSIVGDTLGTSLYVCDTKYIWQYSFTNDIMSVKAHSTSLGSGFSGDNGPATSAQLNAPQGIWLTTSNYPTKYHRTDRGYPLATGRIRACTRTTEQRGDDRTVKYSDNTIVIIGYIEISQSISFDIVRMTNLRGSSRKIISVESGWRSTPRQRDDNAICIDYSDAITTGIRDK